MNDVADPVVALPALLDGVSAQQRVNNGVDSLLQVLYEDGVPCHHGLLYHIYIAATQHLTVKALDSSLH